MRVCNSHGDDLLAMVVLPQGVPERVTKTNVSDLIQRIAFSNWWAYQASAITWEAKFHSITNPQSPCLNVVDFQEESCVLCRGHGADYVIIRMLAANSRKRKALKMHEYPIMQQSAAKEGRLFGLTPDPWRKAEEDKNSGFKVWDRELRSFCAHYFNYGWLNLVYPRAT